MELGHLVFQGQKLASQFDHCHRAGGRLCRSVNIKRVMELGHLVFQGQKPASRFDHCHRAGGNLKLNSLKD